MRLLRSCRYQICAVWWVECHIADQLKAACFYLVLSWCFPYCWGHMFHSEAEFLSRNVVQVICIYMFMHRFQKDCTSLWWILCSPCVSRMGCLGICCSDCASNVVSTIVNTSSLFESFTVFHRCVSHAAMCHHGQVFNGHKTCDGDRWKVYLLLKCWRIYLWEVSRDLQYSSILLRNEIMDHGMYIKS